MIEFSKRSKCPRGLCTIRNTFLPFLFRLVASDGLRSSYGGSTIGKCSGEGGGTPLPDGDRGGDALAASDWVDVGRRLQASFG